MKKKLRLVLGISIFILIIGTALFSWLGYKIDHHAITTADGKYETLIVLGAKVKQNSEPSLALAYRLDEAAAYLKQHPHVNVIVTGGQGADEPISEASAMKTYLIQQGIAENRITTEDQSTSTYENLRNTIDLYDGQLTEATIVSSDFHLARTHYIAKKLQLKMDTIAAKTPAVVQQKTRFREKLALLKTYVVGK